MPLLELVGVSCASLGILEPEIGVVGIPLLELVGDPCVLVLPSGVLEVEAEDGVGAVPLLELVGVSCELVLP